jgi:type II secretory pathway component GspD/PulD (secretin)
MTLTKFLKSNGLLWAAATVLAVGALQADLVAQEKPKPVKTETTASEKVVLKENGGYFLSVSAKDVPLTQIASELSTQLKAPVILSPLMQKQKVTISFEDLPLESALQMLAPQPYVHYELRGGSTPICREIVLNAFNERVPPTKLENKNVSFVIQGDTESMADSKDDPLQVSYKNRLLSVRVKKQSITAVLDRIASEIGVNFSMKQDTNDTIDLDFKDVSLEDAMSYLPPSVHLHVRKDIQRLSTVPLLVELVN